MTIRKLNQSDAAAFRCLRLSGLVECPTAFGSSYEEEVAVDIPDIRDRLKPTDGSALFGYFDESRLAGVVGLQREANQKMRHKAFIWGMYVQPSARRKGVGRALLEHAMDYATSLYGVRQVTLCVVVDNVAARSLYEIAGFQSYGTEPEALFVAGKYYDEELMVQYVKTT